MVLHDRLPLPLSRTTQSLSVSNYQQEGAITEEFCNRLHQSNSCHLLHNCNFFIIFCFCAVRRVKLTVSTAFERTLIYRIVSYRIATLSCTISEIVLLIYQNFKHTHLMLIHYNNVLFACDNFNLLLQDSAEL